MSSDLFDYDNDITSALEVQIHFCHVIAAFKGFDFTI